MIGRYIFNDTQLTSLSIPKNVISIGDYVFSSSAKLKAIYCTPTTPPSFGNENQLPASIVIYVPQSSIEAYKTAPKWSSFASKIIGYDF